MSRRHRFRIAQLPVSAVPAGMAAGASVVTGVGRSTKVGVGAAVGAASVSGIAPSSGELFDWGGTAHYTLKVIYPMPTGTAGTGLHASNRCYFAYPGIEYNIQACGRGGVYPYLYELENAPAGMTIGAFTGEISWPNPQTTATNVLVRITDTKGSTATATWSITVGTSGWRFVDAVNGNAHSTNGGSGTGTLANPWRTLDDVYDGSAGSDRVYFRTGTYTVGNLPRTNIDEVNGEEVVNWNSSTRSCIWLAYPGEVPIIDYEYTGTGAPYNTGDSVPRFNLASSAVYLDGLETTRSMIMAFQFGRGNRYGVHVRRMKMHDHGPGLSGSNTGFLMWQQMYGSGASHDTPAFYDVVYGCEFYNIDESGISNAGSCALKMYSMWEPLIAHNTVHDINCGGEDEAAFAVKSNDSRVCLRGNIFYNMTTQCIGGNNHNALDDNFVDEHTSGEYIFNNIKDCASTTGGVSVGHQNGTGFFGPFYIERNTFQCRLNISWVTANTTQVIVYKRNVIENADGAQTPWPFVVEESISNQTPVTINISSNPELSPTGDENLAGSAANAMVDVDGALIGTFRTNFLGSWGHEIP